jgi:hemerythrin
MVNWTERFATGSKVIDQQHRMLINNLNHLESMLTGTNPTREEGEFLIHLIDFLESYAITHFEFEEQCMERYRCPAHAQNKQAHQQFLTLISQFKERCNQEGLRPEILRSLHHTLSSWIEDHIPHVDAQLRPCIKD